MYIQAELRSHVVTCTTSKRKLLEEMGSQFHEEKIMFLFMFYYKWFSLRVTFKRLKHVTLNDIYLVVLKVYLRNN
jgi:hypothetical protein